MSQITSRVTLSIFLISITMVGARISLSRAKAEQTATPALTVRHDPRTNTISVYKSGGRTTILTEHAGAEARPYIHPLAAPDGTVITGPAGLFWAFTNLNGRDYFHNSGGEYWRRVSVDE